MGNRDVESSVGYRREKTRLYLLSISRLMIHNSIQKVKINQDWKEIVIEKSEWIAGALGWLSQVRACLGLRS